MKPTRMALDVNRADFLQALSIAAGLAPVRGPAILVFER
jgi:hypothetical protein